MDAEAGFFLADQEKPRPSVSLGGWRVFPNRGVLPAGSAIVQALLCHPSLPTAAYSV